MSNSDNIHHSSSSICVIPAALNPLVARFRWSTRCWWHFTIHQADNGFMMVNRKSTSSLTPCSSCLHTSFPSMPVLKFSLYKLLYSLVRTQVKWLLPICTIVWDSHIQDIVLFQLLQNSRSALPLENIKDNKTRIAWIKHQIFKLLLHISNSTVVLFK